MKLSIFTNKYKFAVPTFFQKNMPGRFFIVLLSEYTKKWIDPHKFFFVKNDDFKIVVFWLSIFMVNLFFVLKLLSPFNF